MAEYEFVSGLGRYIQSFIQQKRSSGFPYRSSARILRHFDIMVSEQFPYDRTLTKEACQKWINLKPDEHPNGLLRRVTPIRQLGKYMNGMGISAYILPGHIPDRQIRYEAHIYTEKELKAFFSSIDNCPRSPFSPTRCYVIPVLFRMIFCCGLRSSEARMLLMKDVDLESGMVTIRESKGWKSRIVYMSDDVLEVCREYCTILEKMIPHRKVFFPNKNGNYFHKGTIDIWFHEFWDLLPEARLISGNPARVHDFRHTYAVTKLNSWVKEGLDTSVLYPYLSEYMGHSNFADTDYYLSLVDSFYPEIERRMAEINEDILPEVRNEKE